MDYELTDDRSMCAWRSETVLEFIFVPTHKTLFELSVSIGLLLIWCLTFLLVDGVSVEWHLSDGVVNFGY